MGNIKLADYIFGPALFTEIGTSSFNVAVCSYFICTIFAIFVQPFSWVVLVFIIGNALVLADSVWRMTSLMMACEQINDGLEKAKDNLQNFQVVAIKLLLPDSAVSQLLGFF